MIVKVKVYYYSIASIRALDGEFYQVFIGGKLRFCKSLSDLMY